MFLDHIRPCGLIVVLVLLLSAGCASRHPGLEVYVSRSGIPPILELHDTPYFPQEEYQCGPAALATVLAATDVPVEPQELTGKIYLPGRQGSLQLELIAASRRYARLPYVLDRELSALLDELAAGRPVLVMQNLGLASYPVWHYAVVIGFDAARDELILRSGEHRRHTMSTRRFLRAWELADYWALVVLRPGEIPAAVDETRYVRGIVTLEAAGQSEAAAVFYRTALSLWPDNTLALFGMGNTYYAQGNREAAETAYRRLLQTSPGHAAARNNLALLLAERGCRAAALAELETALTVVDQGDPMRQRLLETRGEILGAEAEAVDVAMPCPANASSPRSAAGAR